VKADAELARGACPGLLEGHRARLALARGDPREAVALARSALTRQEEAARPTEDTVFLTLILADAANASGDFALGRASAQRALGGANELLGELKHSSHVGQARLALGPATRPGN
jgi:hypothetical protein